MPASQIRLDLRPFLFALLLTVAVGCSAQREGAAESAAADDAASAPVPALDAAAPAPMPISQAERAPDADVQTAGVDPGQLASAVNVATDPARRFVRTATANFQVEDVYRSTLAIEDAVAAEAGFVVENRIDTKRVREIERPAGDGKLLRLSEVQTQGSLVVRIPSDRTQSFLRVISKQMAFLDARSFEARDVQFDLLRQQLAYQRGQEVQRDIARAGDQPGKTGAKVDAAMARAEVLAARDEAVLAQREMEDRIGFSTLTLQLQQPMQVREQVVPDTDAILRARGPGFFSEAGDAIEAGWRGLLSMVVLLVGLWPLWLVAIAIVLAVRALRHRRSRRTLQVAPAG